MKTLLLFLSVTTSALAGDYEELLKDRRAVEKVYHGHCLNTQTSFEKAGASGFFFENDLRELAQLFCS